MIETAIALILFLFPLAYSPGPGNIFFAANGARFGFRATIPANMGYHIATWIVTVAVGLGLAAVMAEFPVIFSALKIVGAAYVLWLAWKLFRSGTLSGDQAARPAGFFDGALLLLLNPKAYLILALMFTQFLAPSEAGKIAAVLFIATIFTLNNMVAFTVWTLAGDRVAGQFRSAARAGALNKLFGVVLAAVAVWMVLS